MKTALLTLLVVFATAMAYLRYGRPWQLTWGATPAEVTRPLPGDELVARPTFNATRAITTAAAPEEIWPWLVQVGVRRAGWYSYDFPRQLHAPQRRPHHPRAAAPGSG